ncbi:MAG: cation:proton antiporter [Blastocatellia bacterium]|nr:cation:proton antiporter [Chloracidobacterium sp.]MBL8183853.1 cation:proton antiporter [Blastocatellia bacterium]HBE82393.1 cation:proton antiporter [Blastocatellia bacterium]HRJ89400.1 cation:proton antiporter [Pyrinomonadaceae bacterium]HRK51730.1 cation:proton antiporter [Pyrinomonadaceae bacterium]
MPIIFAAAAEHSQVLFALFIMIAAAKLMAELFERLRQPAVVGEILAGVIVGPSVLGWVRPSEIIGIVAEIGVIFLLFMVGLETKPQSVYRVGKKAMLVGTLGVILPFIAGYFIALLWGGSFIEAMFIGAALVATSVGITARVLGSMDLLDKETSRIILGAAVIDDILGLIILSVVSAMSSGDINYLELGKTAALAIAFTLLVAVLGARMMNKVAPKVSNLRVSKPFFNVGLILCLGLSVASIYVGVAAIIGAFLAGMAMAEATEDNPGMHKLTSGVTEFLVPFFLVNIGMQLNLAVFKDASFLLLAFVITFFAVITKFIGCSIGAWGLTRREMAQVGVGMIPRGEVGIVVAQIGLGLAVITERFFAAVLFMAVATTLIAPPLIKYFYAEDKDNDGVLDPILERDVSEEFTRIG